MRKEIETAKPITKYEQVLSDARQQLTLAEDLLAKRRSEAVAAIGAVVKEEAVVNALRAVYGALEKSLVPQPRQRSTKKPSASPPAHREPTATPATLCAFIYPDKSACNCAEDNPIHEPEGGYAGYHPFTKSVARAPRKSKQKEAHTLSIPSSETSSEGATGAALAASGGVSGD